MSVIGGYPAQLPRCVWYTNSATRAKLYPTLPTMAPYDTLQLAAVLSTL